MIRRLFGGITIIALCLGILVGCNQVKFDQTTHKDDLLTETYSLSEIEKLNAPEIRGHMRLREFKREFKVQCARKTHQGCYVVLLLEDGSNAFVFFDAEERLDRVMVTNGFKTKAEFETYVTEQMPQCELLKFDPNATFASNSVVTETTTTAHIVQEGIFLVEYLQIREGEFLEDPVVISTEFVQNKNIQTNDWGCNIVPYILEIDKISK